MKDIADAFRNPDREAITDLVRCLDLINASPELSAYKEHAWRALEIMPGQTILDVACGVGVDLATLARQRPETCFFGVDLSRKFLDIAIRRAAGLTNLNFLGGDAMRLPFANASFDAIRIDRALQHIADPAGAIAEMRRVARPGARIVATEPDWGSFVLNNGDVETSARLAQIFRESIRNPCLARQIGVLFDSVGLEGISYAPHCLFQRDFGSANVIYDLDRVLAQSVALGIVDAAAAQNWRTQAEKASETGCFVASLTIFECVGRAKGPVAS